MVHGRRRRISAVWLAIVLSTLVGIGLTVGIEPAMASERRAPTTDLVGDCPQYIQYGDSGPCVSEVQRALNREGGALRVDGRFGPDTRAAVTRFQSRHGLGVDGIVGPETKAALSGGSDPEPSPPDDETRATPAQIAGVILRTPGAQLQTVHVSGVRDNATARQNIQDTAAGRPAQRSSYQNAPGGTVRIDRRVLGVVLALGKEGGIRVSEIAGGSHSPDSKHYAGVAVDIDQYPRGDSQVVVAKCRQFGANLAFLEDRTHVHCEW